MTATDCICDGAEYGPDNWCRYPDEPVQVEGTVIDRLDGHGPTFRFRVSVDGAFCCARYTLADLLANHSADLIAEKKRTP